MRKLFLLIFISFSISVSALEVTRVEPLNFGMLSPKNTKRKRISPSKGARIFVRGIPGRAVEAEVDSDIILSSNGMKLKFEKANFENSTIVLDKSGRGVFHLGAVLSISELKKTGPFKEDVWLRVEYVD